MSMMSMMSMMVEDECYVCIQCKIAVQTSEGGDREG